MLCCGLCCYVVFSCVVCVVLLCYVVLCPVLCYVELCCAFLLCMSLLYMRNGWAGGRLIVRPP